MLLVRRDNIYRSWITDARQLDGELEACKWALAEMLEHGIILRLAAYLQSISYNTKDDNPNETGQFEGTSMFVGAAGWREIGTEQHIRDLLQRTTFRLRDYISTCCSPEFLGL